MATRSHKKGTAKSTAQSRPPSGDGQDVRAYVPESPQPVRARTGAGNIVLLLAGLAGLLMITWFGVSQFMPGLLPEGLRPLPTPPPTEGSGGASHPDGRISFLRSQGGKFDLYVVNPDGTNQQQITQDLTIEGSMDWSPDGRRLVVQANLAGVSTVARITLGADNRPLPNESVQLTADVKADSGLPVWSPDATMIAFQSKREGGDYQVFVMDADGNNKRRLSDGKGFAGQPAWSPDGKSIIYVAGERADASVPKDLMVVPVGGGEPRKLLSRGTSLRRPLWSRDGQSIVCVEGPAERNEAVLVVNADGSNPRVLAQAGRIPQISPRGDRVAYWLVDTQAGGTDVFVVPVNGGTPTNITTQSPEDYYPAWSHDGTRLTWASAQTGGPTGHKIVVGNPDGSDVRAISSGDGDDYFPLWSPPVR